MERHNNLNPTSLTTNLNDSPIVFNDLPYIRPYLPSAVPGLFPPPIININTDIINEPNTYRNRINNIILLLNTIDGIQDNNNNHNNYSRMNSPLSDIKYIDPILIPALKKEIVFFKNNKYSYYHLCQLNLIFKNKFDIILNIDFSIKKVLLRCKYIIKINILDRETQCNNHKCDEHFCDGKTHLSCKKRKLLSRIENFSSEDLMKTLEEKIQDFKYCTECTVLWNINSNDRLVDDQNDLDICDNCIFKKHMNDKTLYVLDKCSICLKNIYENDFEKTLCKHYFHKECIENWLVSKNTCPLCRHKLKNDQYQFHENFNEPIIEEL